MTIREFVMPRTARGNDAGDHIGDESYEHELKERINGAAAPTPQRCADPSAPSGISLDDFYAHAPDHKFIYAPTRDLWPAASVDSRLPWPVVEGKRIKPSAWLDAHRSVAQMVWMPGEPMVLNDQLLDGGGIIKRPGVAVFNLYRGPVITPGDPAAAGPWLDHIRRIYPQEADHIIAWLAHRVQRPGEKVNHALVLGGGQGIGKDTLLEPVRDAVGPWNVSEISPTALLREFNGFVKSVILRINEARDLGEDNRFAFYDHTKIYTAAPPEVLRCNEKNLREYSVINCCGVVYTTNYKASGIYLPADDRRHFVAWSEAERTDFEADYWNVLYRWFNTGGRGHVAAYLRALDLSDFDPKAPPRKTAAFWHIVNAARPAEEAELHDLLEKMERPDALTLRDLSAAALGADLSDIGIWLRDRKNRRQIPHRLEEVGYEQVRNDGARDGLWKVSGHRQAIYARREMQQRDRIRAAQIRTAKP